jgi:hypothetical protein
MLTFALITSTTALAQSREELCHNAAESDVVIKHSLQKDPSSFADFLRYIDEVEKNPRMKAALREKAFWVYNRRSLPEEEFTRLSIVRCLLQ